MNKFKTNDIKLKSHGVQIRNKIFEKYGSIKNFAEEIDLYESSINQYLMSKKLGSSTFKIRTTRAFGMDFDDLYLTEEEQIRHFATTISLNIDEYNQTSDRDVLKKLMTLILERELMEDYAIVCRCYAYYYFNQGIKDRAYSYIDAAVNTMRGREYIDRFGLYLSDMLYMKAKDLTNQEFKKIVSEFDETLVKVGGPLTTGHMYRNMAKAYFELGNLDMSEDYYRKVFIYHEDIESQIFLYMRLAEIEKERNSTDKAFDYYVKAEKMMPENSEVRFNVYNQYAKYYFENNELVKASEYMDLIFKEGDWIISSRYHDFVYTYLKVKGAVKSYESIQNLLDRLFNELEEGYTHAVRHMKQFGLGLEFIKSERKLLLEMNYYLIERIMKAKLTNASNNTIKQLIGELNILLYNAAI
ncbi:hypothetical protein EZV73_11705 [Acidaminobacter sp. JC074]|uniref:tetratricopeptide repeat protein n=1 Tax=Acidaminobacter sp. JC074 TaxID=2530199 RepID=UPI001F10DDC5|nr:hypothetical protein [Acidaminobacter sp. JC074]MCH4888244.1 hypothetical protein [Acidaminobacter sp. JC074]